MGTVREKESAAVKMHRHLMIFKSIRITTENEQAHTWTTRNDTTGC
jgi:hypothetical protein